MRRRTREEEPLCKWLVQAPVGWQAKLQAARQKLSCLKRIFVVNEYCQSDYKGLPDKRAYGLLDPRNHFYDDLSANRCDRMREEFSRGRLRATDQLKNILASSDVKSDSLYQLACLKLFTQMLVSFTQTYLGNFDEYELGDCGDLDVKENVEDQIATAWANTLKPLLHEEENVILGLRLMCETAHELWNYNDRDDDVFFGDEEFGKHWENPPVGFRLALEVVERMINSDPEVATVSALRVMMKVISCHDVQDEGLAVSYLMGYLDEAALRRIAAAKPKKTRSPFSLGPEPALLLSEISLSATTEVCKGVFGSCRLDSWLAALMGHATLICRQIRQGGEVAQSHKRRRLRRKSGGGQDSNVWLKVATEVDLFLDGQAKEEEKCNLVRVMAQLHSPHFYEELEPGIRMRNESSDGDGEDGSEASDDFMYPASPAASDAFSRKVHSWTELIGCMGNRGSCSPEDLTQLLKALSQRARIELARLGSLLLSQKIVPEVVPLVLDLHKYCNSAKEVTLPWASTFSHSHVVSWIFANLTPATLTEAHTQELGIAMLQARNLINIKQFVDFVGVHRFTQDADFMAEMEHIKFEMLTKAHECASKAEFKEMLALRNVLPAVVTLEIASEAMQACIREDPHQKAPKKERERKGVITLASSQRLFAELVASGDVAGCTALKDFMTLACVVTRFNDLSDTCSFLGGLLGCQAYASHTTVLTSLQASNCDARACARVLTESSGHLYGNRKMDEAARIKASTWIDMVLSILREHFKD